jgi:preprotein translocase subunit SecE
MGRLLRKKDPKKKVKKKQSEAEVGQKPNSPAAETTVQPTVKKAYTPVSKPTIVKEKNIVDKSIQFLREVKVELKKVTWPSKKTDHGLYRGGIGDRSDHFAFPRYCGCRFIRPDSRRIAIMQERS